MSSILLALAINMWTHGRCIIIVHLRYTSTINILQFTIHTMSESQNSQGRKRKILALEDRIGVIKSSEKGKSSRKIADRIGVGRTQVQQIIKEKANLMREGEEGQKI